MDIQVKKRNSDIVEFDGGKIKKALKKCLKRCHIRYTTELYQNIEAAIKEANRKLLGVEEIQNIIEKELMKIHPDAAKEYILYRKQKEQIREWAKSKEDFIKRYKGSFNTADGTVDDNSNVSNHNIGVLNSEIHKEDNIQISRRMITNKLEDIFPEFDHKQYVRDLENHIIYKHDESSFAGAVAPYCVAVTMYPFLNNGIKDIGGLSAKPQNLDSYCGIFINMIFAVASQFAGAVACGEFFLIFDYFARKEWGNDYYLHLNDVVNPRSTHPRTIQEQIHQYFQQVIYSINQPAAARGMQSAFVNFSYYDKTFFDGMFGDFYFPDNTQPIWESLCWLQKDFMQWFNNERLRCVMTFPVETFALVYKNGKFLDQESADFVAEEYARGHSFFTYISDSVDSLSSCCFSADTEISYVKDGFIVTDTFKNAWKKDKDENVQIRSYNPYTKKFEFKPGKLIKTESENWVEVTSNTGYKIKMTSDHILPIRKDKKIIDINASDIAIGDEIMIFNRTDWELDNDKGIQYQKILDIRKIKKNEDCYCIEMNDQESPYFILDSGLVTHNCRLRNALTTKEFNFTNGNAGVMTGSKSVLTLNLSRIIQDWYNTTSSDKAFQDPENNIKLFETEFPAYLNQILERVYKYHIAYNELLWDMKDAHMLPVYDAGFIDLNKQYLTIGINGLNQAAEYLGLECRDNTLYEKFCNIILGNIANANQKHGTKFNGHKLMFNTEQVPGESLAGKNYSWDKEDGYWVPEDTNLYASYIFKPNDSEVSVLEKIRLHGKKYIGLCDGGQSAHINLEEHLSKEQYKHLLDYAGQVGCNYLTFNIPISQCDDCGKIYNRNIDCCPECHSENITKYTRIIGYLTAIKNWSEGRRQEFNTRIFTSPELKGGSTIKSIY